MTQTAVALEAYNAYWANSFIPAADSHVDGFDPHSGGNSPLAGQNLRIQILNPKKIAFHI